MNYLGTIFMAVLLFASCGKKEQGQTKRGVYIDNLNRTPIELFKQYPTCARNETTSDSPYYTLMQFLRGGNIGRNVNLSSSISGRELKGFQIEQTYYDAEMMLKKTIRNGRLVGLDFLVTNNPKPMSICPGVKSYRRYSYENASMSATYSISKTVEKLREVNFSAGPGVKVYVSPFTIERREVELEDRIVREDLRITDNAYYFPHLRAVVFMPQSEESRDGAGFGNVPLWEVPMVGSHEYGHHVFHSVMKSASSELADYNHSCFSEASQSERRFDGQLEDELVARSVGVSDVLGSLNEGFADLISYYTLDDGERGLRGVVCMEINRDVGSSVFANDTPKLFSGNMMDTFLSPYPAESGGCYQPNFQQIHTVGAVFANVSDRLMRSLGLNKKQKLAVTIAWLKDMNTYHSRMSGQGAEKYLVKAMTLMSARAMSMSDAIPAQKCRNVEYYMPRSEYTADELEILGCD